MFAVRSALDVDGEVHMEITHNFERTDKGWAVTYRLSGDLKHTVFVNGSDEDARKFAASVSGGVVADIVADTFSNYLELRLGEWIAQKKSPA
jgi:hypothetical protein